MNIHPTAIVDPSAQVPASCRIGPYCIVHSGVELGENCELISNVVLGGPSRFGNNNGGWFRVALAIAKRVSAISTEEGGETVVYLASAPEVQATSGGYFVKSAPASPSAAAQDDASAGRLWSASERFVRPLSAKE